MITLAEAIAHARQVAAENDKRRQEMRENDPDSKPYCLCDCEHCQKCGQETGVEPQEKNSSVEG
jgi:hypothetical protein